MTVSTTSNFEANRNQIVVSALRKVGAIGEDEFPSSYMLDNAVFMLNTIIKEAHNDGMPLWAIDERVIPCNSLVNGQLTLGTIGSLDPNTPLKVLHAYIRTQVGSNEPTDIPMEVLTHYDYNWLSTKQAKGMPIQYFYDPAVHTGSLKVWPIPDEFSKLHRRIVLTFQRPFRDAGNATNTLDFPSSWNLALIYQLAWTLCPEYGVPLQDRTALAKEAELFRNRALSFGTEEGSLYLSPDWTASRGD
jgi:hypothetical protein